MALDTTIGGTAADSYGELAALDTYATSMGWTLTGIDAVKEANMRRATAFLDRQYEWVGYRVDTDQALAWPRSDGGYDSDGWAIPFEAIPQKIINAQFELAYLENTGVDLLAYSAGAAIKREKVKAGPVEAETEYVVGDEAESRIIAIEGLLRDYITTGQQGETSGMIPRYRG